MKNLIALTIVLAAQCLAVLSVSPSAAQQPEFCWKDSSTRGIGEVPQQCDPGRERIGLLCYTRCPANMARVGFDCHSVCPSQLRDDGLFCRAAEYGRGAGYPWEFGDSLDDSGMFSRCERDQGRGNCEKSGAIVYPKCKAGYEAVGCCICRPQTPNCAALGLNGSVDLSCAKKVTIGDPVTGTCGSGQQKDAGLCYSSCGTGYQGVGPVCWGQPPPGWVNCGMGAAKDEKTCAAIVFGQVSSVGQMAFFVATFGSSTPLTAGMDAPATASRLAKLKQQFSQLQVAFENLKQTNAAVKGAVQTLDAANKGRQGYIAIGTAVNAVTEEDMVRAAAQMAAILDPTGVAATISAYTYPKCSKYGFSPTGPAPAAAGVGWTAGPAIPANAVIGGQQGTLTLPICRATYQGGVHPGKVVGANCNIGWGGKEIVLPTFEVMTNSTDLLVWTAGPSIPANAVMGGQATGVSLPICRASYEGGVHPGKVVGANCNIGWGGNEIVLPSFEVLTIGSAAPSWTAGPAIPANAVIGGQEAGRTLAVCHAKYEGGVHPGKVVGAGCNIGWGGKEVAVAPFEVLTSGSAVLLWIPGPTIPANAVIGGQAPGITLPICRASYEGGVHPGKVVTGNCNIGWGGKEIVLPNFDVLVQSSPR